MTKKRKKTKTMTSRGKTSLFDVISSITEEYGEGTIMKGNDSPVDVGPRISTGSISLDIALGGRGIPRGRVVEIFGPESSGKTTLALHLLANAQKKGIPTAFIDAEHALDPVYAKNLGVVLGDTLISQPDYGEQALNILIKLIKGGVKLVVVDSVAALTPKAEIDGEMGDMVIGLQARLMSKAMRKLVALVNKKDALIVFINQTRSTIGGGKFAPKTTSGGAALRFYSSVRIEVRRRKTTKKKNKAVSNLTYAKVVKSKICVPFKTGEFIITFGKGIDRPEEIVHWGKKGKVIKASGGNLRYGKLKAKGIDAFASKVRMKKKVRIKLIKEVKAFIKEAI